MTTRPRVRLLGAGERAAAVRRWLLQSGAEPVGPGDAAEAVVVVDAGGRVERGLPVLDAATAPREEVADFVRALAGKEPHAFDDHGSPEAWPRGSY